MINRSETLALRMARAHRALLALIDSLSKEKEGAVFYKKEVMNIEMLLVNSVT